MKDSYFSGRPVKAGIASFVLALLLGGAPAYGAAGPFYEGTWRIESASVAPWWEGSSKPEPDGAEAMVGQSLTIARGAITGPRQLACAAPRYSVKRVPAPGLFQGMFDEMRRRGQGLADPAKLAAQVGFEGGRRASWRTLETGCENELEFHFIDARTAAFALDNYIYRLKKQ